MKKLVFIVLISFYGNHIFSQSNNYQDIKNNGFETWNYDEDGNIEPDFWHTITSATGRYAGMVSDQVSRSERTRPGSTGRYSALLRPRSVFGVLTNGNLTNGRINAGSMRISNKADNYDYTQRDDPRFCTPVSRVPDSIVAWVCYRTKGHSSQANFVAVVHSDVNFIYAGPKDSRPLEAMCAISGPHPISRTAAAGSDDYTWRRVSVPFVTTNKEAKPSYILILFSTNRLAGEGSSKDEMYIDDVELIYND